MDHLIAYFCFLNTLRLGNLKIGFLGVITIRFWDDKYLTLETYINWLLSIFWSFRIIYIIIQCIMVSILSWPMIHTQYVFLVLTPTCIFFSVILWSAASVPATSTRPQL